MKVPLVATLLPCYSPLMMHAVKKGTHCILAPDENVCAAPGRKSQVLIKPGASPTLDYSITFTVVVIVKYTEALESHDP